MAIRSTKEIYQVLEKALRDSECPMTCVDLMDIPSIRETAIAEYGKDIRIVTNKVSDALGFMWRRTLLVRYPAPAGPNSLARYAYAWDRSRDLQPALKPVPPPLLPRKSAVSITEEDGGVLIEFDKFTVFVKPK